MLRSFCYLAILLPLVQSDPSSFYVDPIAQSKYHPGYIFNHAHHFIPPDERIKVSEAQNNIKCLINELKASGLFEDVKAKLVRSDKENFRQLDIDTTYQREVESFVISEVALEGFPEVDNARFQSALKKKGVRPWMRFLKYNYRELEERVIDALRSVYPDDAMTEETTSWVTIRPAGGKELKLIVLSTLPVCKAAT